MFLAAQPCGQDGADRHGQIRERHDAEVPRPHTEDGVICRIKSQDLRREAPCRQQKQCCQHTPADKAYIQTAPRLGVLLRTQKLCDQNAGIAGGAVPQGFKAADGSPCPERRILMNGGQSGNAFPACQCICNTQSPDALFAPPPCLRYIRQSIFAKQPETHYAGNDKAAVQKAEKENRNSAFTPAPAATYVCYTLLGKRR